MLNLLSFDLSAFVIEILTQELLQRCKNTFPKTAFCFKKLTAVGVMVKLTE